jgi:DNA-binding MarR family transcriptional regulator
VDDKDKRAYKVYLTEEGRKVTAEISEVLHNWNDILTSGFTEEEKGIALNLLQRMLENKNKQISKGECK